VVMVFESFRCGPSPRDWSNLSQKVLVYKEFMFEALYAVMVSESFRCRPYPWDWSNLFQKEIIFAKSICFWIEALYMVMVTESFRCRPSPRDWSNLFKKKLYCQKVYVLVSGPSTWQWSSNPLDVDPLLGIGLIFLKKFSLQKVYDFLDQGPLRGNGH